jgi:hypothetical protein
VIVCLDAEPACDLDDLFGHLDIGSRRCRVSSGMIVHHPTDSFRPADLVERIRRLVSVGSGASH